MLVGRAQGEAIQVQAIVVAFEQEEITFNEFSEALGSLTPEAIQVISLLLRSWTHLDREKLNRVTPARLLCLELACRTRLLS